MGHQKISFNVPSTDPVPFQGVRGTATLMELVFFKRYTKTEDNWGWGVKNYAKKKNGICERFLRVKLKRFVGL